MTWTHARRYHGILGAVVRELDLAPGRPVPWRHEYEAVFGRPERLRLALLTQWRTILEAQGQDLPLAEIVARHPGLAGLAGLPMAHRDLEPVAS